MADTRKPLYERIPSQRARQVAATFPQQTSISREGLITMSGGTPDFQTPEHIVEAGRQALTDGQTKYTAWYGIEPLREAIAEKLARENDLQVNPEDEVFVTAGSQAAMISIILAMIDPGDEVLVPVPFYGEYRRDLMLAGGELVPVVTHLEENFEVDPDALEAAITPQTKAMILITPSNPTGGIIRGETLERLAEIAQEHDLLVISDELYERYMYGDYDHVSIASLPGMWERTVTINGFSKCYGMTGWRVGYITAPADIIRAMLPFHHGMNICAPAVSQWAALAALQGPHDWFEDILDQYNERREAWMRGLDEMGLPYGEPQGAYYIMFDNTSTGLTSQEFAKAMREEAKVIVGGGGGRTDPFNEGYNRGSFVVPLDKLEEGLARMKPVVEKYQAQNS
jgi:aminotransferase